MHFFFFKTFLSRLSFCGLFACSYGGRESLFFPPSVSPCGALEHTCRQCTCQPQLTGDISTGCAQVLLQNDLVSLKHSDLFSKICPALSVVDTGI